MVVMIPAARAIGIALFALAAGCAGDKYAPGQGDAQSGPLTVDPSLIRSNQRPAVAAEPARSEPREAAIVALAPSRPGSRQPGMTGDEATAIEAVAAVSPASPTAPATPRSTARADLPPAKAVRSLDEAPARIAASAAAIEQPPNKVTPAPVAARAEPPLDVAALKARLRDTKAIGVFTKLALKNQVDDLLQQFRTHTAIATGSS